MSALFDEKLTDERYYSNYDSGEDITITFISSQTG